MELILKRTFKGPKYTIGKLYIDGSYFCDTLEDVDRGLKSSTPIGEILSKKIKGQTAIPTGTYQITLNVYSPKFGIKPAYQFCGGKVPRLLNVPGFDGILIHIGNTPEDTMGCILVGQNKVKGQVINSTDTFKKFYNKIKGNTRLTITII